MRIVLSHVYAWPEVRRGGERYLHELAGGLAEAGHRVTVLATTPDRPRTDTVLGVPVTYFRRRQPAYRYLLDVADEMAFGVEAGAWVARRGADAWHALGTADAGAAALLGPVRRFRSVHTTLGVPDRWYRDTRPDRRVHDLVIKRVDDYVCLSRSAGQALENGWGRVPLVVGGGVDMRRFGPAPARHPRPALLYSGNFSDPRKGLALLIDATALLRKRYPDLELWLSGSGDLSKTLAAAPAAGKEAIVDLGLGAEEDQAGRYGRAWATVLPSVHEAFGLCLIESLACGTPVVALAAGGGPAEIVKPGVGVLAGSSAAELADACETAFALAAEPGIVDACRAEAEGYDWRRTIVPRFERIYRGEG